MRWEVNEQNVERKANCMAGHSISDHLANLGKTKTTSPCIYNQPEESSSSDKVPTVQVVAFTFSPGIPIE